MNCKDDNVAGVDFYIIQCVGIKDLNSKAQKGCMRELNYGWHACSEGLLVFGT